MSEIRILWGGSNEGEAAERPSHVSFWFDGLYNAAVGPRFVTWMKGQERGEWVSFQPVIDRVKSWVRKQTIDEIIETMPYCFTDKDLAALEEMKNE